MSNENWTQLLERIEKIEQEVRAIKQVVALESSKEVDEPPKKETIPIEPTKEVVREVSVIVPAPTKEHTKTWEIELGQKWLPRVFLFVLIIGFIWGFVAAVEEGWITEPLRIVIGFSVAGLLYILGEKQLRNHRKNLGVTLLAGTIILLILTTFAMNTLYGYIGFWFAFVLHVVWIGLGLYLSHKHESEVLGILVAIGGYFVPFLIEGAQDQNPLLFYIYEVMLYGGYLIYAMKKSYTKLHYIAFFFLHIVTWCYTFISPDELFYPMMLFWLQHLVLIYAFNVYGNFQKTHYYTSLLTSFFLNIAWMNALWNETQIEITLLIISCLYIVTALLTWKEAAIKRSLSITVATVAFGLFALSAIEQDYVQIIFIIEGFIAVVLAKVIQDKFQWGVGAFILALGLLNTVNQTIDEWFSPELLSYGLALGTLVMLFISRKDAFTNFIPNYEKISAVTLTGYILYFITQLTHLLFVGAEEVTSAIAISVAWLIYAIGFILLGKWKTNSACNIFGIVMLFVVLLKVIFVDLSISSIAVKAVLFVALGAIGLVVSRFFYQSDKPIN